MLEIHSQCGLRDLYSGQDLKISQRRKLIYRQMGAEGNRPFTSLVQAYGLHPGLRGLLRNLRAKEGAVACSVILPKPRLRGY